MKICDCSIQVKSELVVRRSTKCQLDTNETMLFTSEMFFLKFRFG